VSPLAPLSERQPIADRLRRLTVVHEHIEARLISYDADFLREVAERIAPAVPDDDTIRVGDLVTGEWFRGEKRVTEVDRDGVMVQITPRYEQAYFHHQVQKVVRKPVGSGTRD
jgi:hypothetical protein